jgi:hypothetical protein
MFGLVKTKTLLSNDAVHGQRYLDAHSLLYGQKRFSTLTTNKLMIFEEVISIFCEVLVSTLSKCGVFNIKV